MRRCRGRPRKRTPVFGLDLHVADFDLLDLRSRIGSEAVSPMFSSLKVGSTILRGDTTLAAGRFDIALSQRASREVH